jgi:hypothetical protein
MAGYMESINSVLGPHILARIIRIRTHRIKAAMAPTLRSCQNPSGTVCLLSDVVMRAINPNSEIQTGKMTQDLGAETNRKNRGIPKVVCRDFFNSFMPKRLRQIAGFNFGFRD